MRNYSKGLENLCFEGLLGKQSTSMTFSVRVAESFGKLRNLNCQAGEALVPPTNSRCSYCPALSPFARPFEYLRDLYCKAGELIACPAKRGTTGKFQMFILHDPFPICPALRVPQGPVL